MSKRTLGPRIRIEEIVDQAELSARELLLVAVLWTEGWYEKLKVAWKLFFVRDA